MQSMASRVTEYRSTDYHSLQWDDHHCGAFNGGGNSTWGCPLPCLQWDRWAVSPPTGSTEQICSQIYKGNSDLGYTDAVRHHVHTMDNAPVAQPCRSIPPNHLQEIKENIKGLLAWKVTVESYNPYKPVVLVEKWWKPLIVCGLYHAEC